MTESLSGIKDADNEPAYILHRQAYRESSYLLDIFSLNTGKLRVLAKGAKTSKRINSANLQMFQPLLLSWRGRGELKVLTSAESSSASLGLQGQRLYCGFYLNELLMRLYPDLDPNPIIFAVYAKALSDLAKDVPMDLPLRQFELQLCEGLGIAPDFQRSGKNYNPINDQSFYSWKSQIGFVPVVKGTKGAMCGADLLAIASGYLNSTESNVKDPTYDKQVRKSAKRIMRMVLDEALQGVPLKSRELMAQISKGVKQ